MENNFKCCFTGYRPQKFPFPLLPSSKEYIDFENSLIKTLFDLSDNGVCEFYCGMAMGFDIIAGECVALLKRVKPDMDVRLVCAIPFEKQSENFPPEWKLRYENLLQLADKVVFTSKEYHKGCFSVRNKFMVDSSDCVVTWFDGKSGGTKNTICYALSKGRKIINLFENANDDLFSAITYYEYDENYEEDE